ncbi:MAG: hypothetical protein ACRCTE_03865 [Cellulosilyticaceae bacterium]
MKTKHLGLLGACVLAIGSYSVFAVTPVEKANPSTFNTSTSDGGTITQEDLYSRMEEMLAVQVSSGNLTEQEADQMLDYCKSRMSDNVRGNGRRRCH